MQSPQVSLLLLGTVLTQMPIVKFTLTVIRFESFRTLRIAPSGVSATKVTFGAEGTFGTQTDAAARKELRCHYRLGEMTSGRSLYVLGRYAKGHTCVLVIQE